MSQQPDADFDEAALGEGIVDPTMEAMTMFDAIDINGDGVIELDELRGEMSAFGMTNKKINELMRNLDIDGNGSIDREEWVYGYSCFVDKSGRSKFCDLRGPDGGFKIEDTAVRAIELSQLEKIYNHVKRQLVKGSWKVSRPSRNTGKWIDVDLKDPEKVNLYDVTSESYHAMMLDESCCVRSARNQASNFPWYLHQGLEWCVTCRPL